MDDGAPIRVVRHGNPSGPRVVLSHGNGFASDSYFPFWRHGAAIDAFAVERAEVLAAWDELRERTRDQGDAVALSPAFRETLDRHGALMKQARIFRARPQVFERLLAERVGLGEREIEELREQHSRAGRHLRSVKARASHAARQDALHEEPGIVEAIAAETAVPAAERAPDGLAPSRTAEETASGPDRDARPDWRTLYRELKRDWNDLVARSQDPDLPLLLIEGYDALIGPRAVRSPIIPASPSTHAACSASSSSTMTTRPWHARQPRGIWLRRNVMSRRIGYLNV